MSYAGVNANIVIFIVLSLQLSEGLVMHGNVHDNVNVFGLSYLLRCCCGRASTETCYYCQYIHNMLLWACKKYCCCTNNIQYEITPIYSIHESHRSRYIQGELGKVEGFWSALQLLQQAQANLIGCCYKKNQSAAPCDDVIMSAWVRPIRLCHLELHDRTLDLSL